MCLMSEETEMVGIPHGERPLPHTGEGPSPIVLMSLLKASGFSVSPATQYRAPLERLIIRAPRVAGRGSCHNPQGRIHKG